jgi:peptide deformylase
MTVRDILLYPKDKTILRAKSTYVEVFEQHTLDLIKDLKDTLHAYTDGIGLAAPQIGVNMRVVIVCLGSQDNQETRQS